MMQGRTRNALLSAAFCAAAAMSGGANAAVYTGNWDPAYGATFESLGWKGTASFFIPDACLASSGWVANTDACAGGGMQVLSANVTFYNVADPLATPVETLTFDPNVLVYKMHVGSNKLDGVSTDFLGPVQAFSSIAGGGVNYFDLKFLEATSHNVQLFHTVGHTDPICAYTGVPAGCGISETSPTMTLTLVTAPIPEPETYALYLAGLGAAWFAKRRRHASARRAD